MQGIHFHLRHTVPLFLCSAVLALFVSLLAWCAIEQLVLSAFWLGLMMAALCLAAALGWCAGRWLVPLVGSRLPKAGGHFLLAGAATVLSVKLPGVFDTGSYGASDFAQIPSVFIGCLAVAGFGWALSTSRDKFASPFGPRLAILLGFCAGAGVLILSGVEYLNLLLWILAAGSAGQGAYLLLVTDEPINPETHAAIVDDAAASNPLKKPLFVLYTAVSGLFLGSYLVVTPYFASAHYSLNLANYAILQLLIFLAALAAFFAIAKRKPADHPGQAAIFSTMYMALISYALSRMPTPFGFHCLMFFWGLNFAYAFSHIALVADNALTFRSTRSPWFSLNLLAAIAAACTSLITALILDFRGQNFPEFFIGLSMANALVFLGFLFTRTLWGWKLARGEE